MSVFVPLLHCFDYCGFVVSSDIWKGYTSCFVLFFPQDCFGNSGSFMVPFKFWIICSRSVKNVMGILIGITLNQWIVLGSIAILTILILPVQEHGISLHLFVLSFFSL